jgi:hypothetical protein
MSDSIAYTIIDETLIDRVHLGEMLTQVDPDADIRAYKGLSQFQAAMSDANLIERMKGIFVKLDDRLDSILNLLHKIRSINPQIYLVVCTQSIDLETLRTLVLKGVNQVLTLPLDETALKEKMRSAEMIQTQTVQDNQALAAGVKFRAWYEHLTDNVTVTSLVGFLGEYCELPKIKPRQNNSTLLIDFEGIKGINSVGIRAWINWMKELQTNGFSQFVLRNVHPNLIGTIQIVSTFIPANCHIDSFYLLYYNEENNVEKEFRFSKDKDFDSERMQVPAIIETFENGVVLRFALDHQLKYFSRFYKGRIVILNEIASRSETY